MKIVLDFYMICYLLFDWLLYVVVEFGYDQIELLLCSDFFDWWVMLCVMWECMVVFCQVLCVSGVGFVLLQLMYCWVSLFDDEW